jgi:hypothetical protein
MFKKFAITLLAFSAICSAQAYFQYGGLSLLTDPSSFKKTYPKSISDKKSVWLSESESHDGVHYIEKQSFEGKEWIKISFEKPADQLEKKPESWEDGHYMRHPQCDEILSKLTKAYGAPAKVNARWEEAIEWRPHRWNHEGERLELNCYTLNGEGKVLAADIVISRKAR